MSELFDDASSMPELQPPPHRPARRPMQVDTVPVRLARSARVDPTEWEERVEQLSTFEEPENVADLRATLRSLDLRDETDVAWSFDGTGWWRWDGANWAPGRPTTLLSLSSIDIEVPQPHVPDAARDVLGVPAAPLPTPAAAAPTFAATHLVPAGGMPVWSVPDPSAAPVAALDPQLEVMAVEWRQDGWTRIVCSNSWSGWVDGRVLVPR